MTRRHDEVFNDVLSGLDAPAPEKGTRAGARFLKRSTAISERLSGELEEKTLRWVDPAECRMWAFHNRDYDLLTEDNCRDLIDGMLAQGRQEFPAIVRRTGDPDQPYEVVCGARRHFAVTWLRANNYPQFKYLVEMRELTDEEAFRLADIENRDREDISDYERAMDYADAVERYYGGKQKAMAARLEVSESWLSRYLHLARLPKDIVAAFASKTEIKERMARDLKPVLASYAARIEVFAEAQRIAEEQERARAGQGAYVDAADVMRRLLRAGRTPKAKAPAEKPKLYGGTGKADSIEVRKKGRKLAVEFDARMGKAALERALREFLAEHYRHGDPG